MSYQGPLLIREPELRWPIVILAAIITALIALMVAGLYYATMTQPVRRESGLEEGGITVAASAKENNLSFKRQEYRP